jgi:hypothetical protein
MFRNILKKTLKIMAGNVAQVVELLLTSTKPRVQTPVLPKQTEL